MKSKSVFLLLPQRDEMMKEKDSLLRALQSPDFNSVALARKNQAQKAKLRSKVINDLSN